jgi:hypothetical protein
MPDRDTRCLLAAALAICGGLVLAVDLWQGWRR